jgi:Reverse transcriptase (RNA-dependent DNA polymerase)
MPDGNMVSLVMQMGECNALATYQALINHLFSSFIGTFMNVYLDNIIIHSDTLEEHVTHVKNVLCILEKEKLDLSKKKLFFLATGGHYTPPPVSHGLLAVCAESARNS